MMLRGASAMGQHPRRSAETFAGLLSILTCALQHAEGVLPMHLVHNELGTPVCPYWDNLRTVW